jgi:hypothetical protein
MEEVAWSGEERNPTRRDRKYQRVLVFLLVNFCGRKMCGLQM